MQPSESEARFAIRFVLLNRNSMLPGMNLSRHRDLTRRALSRLS
jgi:hypothetical protein